MGGSPRSSGKSKGKGKPAAQGKGMRNDEYYWDYGEGRWYVWNYETNVWDPYTPQPDPVQLPPSSSVMNVN